MVGAKRFLAALAFMTVCGLVATPANADARLDACLAGGDPVRIVEACSPLVQAGGLALNQRVAAWFSRGNAYRALDRLQEAIADYDQVLRLHPGYAEAYNNRGLARQALGDVTGAIADYTQALAIKPEFAEALNNRALSHRRRSDFKAAIDDFGLAIAQRPDFAEAWFGRGVVFGDLGDFDSAVSDYSKAIEIDPRHADAYNNRADTYLKTGDNGRAIADLNKAIDLNPVHAEAFYTRGDVYRAVGRYELALADIERAMSLDTKGTHHDFGNALIAELQARLAPDPDAIAAERRVALIIGNGAYEAVTPLDNPSNDAETMAAALRLSGFDSVTVVRDASRGDFVAALQAFAAEADEADWALVYYAGHGVEVGGTNYLVPVDARFATDRDVVDEAITLDRVMAAVEGAARMRVVILDACRNNPFAATMEVTSPSRSLGRGLARVEPDQATLVAFAARAGSVAADGAGDNSPFTAALAKRVTAPGIEVNMVFRQVRADVLAATGNAQEPFVYGSLPPEDFFFVAPKR